MYLLEANSGPDLGLHGARLQEDAERLLADVLNVTSCHLYHGSPADGAAAALCSGESAPPSPAVGDVIGGFTCAQSRRCDQPEAELERFKRCMATVGKFTHSLHKAAGAPVRGVQGVMALARQAET